MAIVLWAMRLHVGTSGYNFDEWKGTFYPDKLPADQWLGYYAGRLQTVEINYTFYRMPNAKTIGQWLEATPDGFTFVLKVSQRITHHARLKEVEQPLRYFCDTAAQLGQKLGPLLFQLPPNFKRDTDRLGEVLRLVPETIDRKSTRLNSSHRCISYAVFCLKKKKYRNEQDDAPVLCPS